MGVSDRHPWDIRCVAQLPDLGLMDSGWRVCRAASSLGRPALNGALGAEAELMKPRMGRLPTVVSIVSS